MRLIRYVMLVSLAMGLTGCGGGCEGESMVDMLAKGPPQHDAGRKVFNPDKKLVRSFVRDLFKKKEELWTPEERALFQQYIGELRAFDKKNKRGLTRLAKDFEKLFQDLMAKEAELRKDPKNVEKLQLWWDNEFSARLQTAIVETGKLCPRGDESMLVPNFYEIHEMMKIQLPSLIQTLWANPKDKNAQDQFDFYRKRGDELVKKMKKHIGQIDAK